MVLRICLINIHFFLFRVLLNNDKFKITYNATDIFFLLFVFWCFFRATFSKTPFINDDTSQLFILLVFYFIVKYNLEDKNNIKSFLITTTIVILTVATTEAIIGILQLYEIIPTNNQYFPITGTFINPAPYSLFLSISFTYALSAYNAGIFVSKVIRYIMLLCCISILLIIPFTSNRASWIAIGAGLIIVLYNKVIQSKFLLNVWKKVALLTCTFIFTFIIGYYLYNYKKESSEGRILVWKVSSQMIREHPILGIGFGRFQSEYNLWQAKYFKDNYNDGKARLAGNVKLAYNEYLEIFVETGIIGLLLFAGMIFTIFYYSKQQEDISNIYLSPIYVFLLLSFVSYPFNLLPTKTLFIFFIACSSSLVNKEKNIPIKVCPGKWLIECVLLFSIALSIVHIKKYQKYKTWLIALKEYNAGNFQMSEAYYQEVYEALKYELNFSLNFSECLNKNKKYKEALMVSESVKDIYSDSELFILMGNSHFNIANYLKAEECYLKAGYMAPSRILPKYLLVKLYNMEKDTAKAKAMSKEILNMDIKIKSDSSEAIVNEIKKMNNI